VQAIISGKEQTSVLDPRLQDIIFMGDHVSLLIGFAVDG
jgi:hypothetical protein